VDIGTLASQQQGASGLEAPSCEKKMKGKLSKQKNKYNQDFHEITLADASLRWLRHHSILRKNDAIILGASSLQHYMENMNSLQNLQPLPNEIVSTFDQAWQLFKPECPCYFR